MSTDKQIAETEEQVEGAELTVEEKIERLRAKYGDVEVLDIPVTEDRPAAVVVVRPMSLKEFVELQHSDAKRMRGASIGDPRIITSPLLECVVMGREAAEAELQDAPGFEQDLMQAVARMAGAMREDISVDYAEEPAPKKPIVLQVGPHRLTFRRFDAFDYSTTRSEIGKYSRDCPGLISPLAMLGVVKRQGVKEAAAELDRALNVYPATAHPMGMLLWQAAQSLAERRAGK